MTQHNNWQDEFNLICKLYDGIPLYSENSTLKNRLESFIDTLLIERTKACVTIAKKNRKNKPGLISMLFGDGRRDVREIDCDYDKACEDIATQITKLIETEE